MDSVFDFEPIKFLRTHSKNKDNADVQTQVWDCAFEPDDVNSFYSGAHTVATCGGNSVCFIDAITGTVLSKYYTKDTSICFFSLAWSSLKDGNKRRSVLAAGASKCSLFFFDSQQKLCVLEHEFKRRRNICINALYFHKCERQVLFCGSSDGMIRVCELKRDQSSSIYSLQLNICISTKSEIFDCSYCLTTRCLLTSTNNGLFSFFFPSKESLQVPSQQNGIKIDIVSEHRRCSSDLVDAVESLKDGLFACKYALHGCIYVCDLKQFKAAKESNKEITAFELEPLHVLKWSNTDNYFMFMGVSVECQILCCGDDKGSLWMYDLSSIVYNKTVISKPTAILPWPVVTDHYNDKKRKLNLDVYDIVIDKVAIHCSGHYIVAVTNNNLVCLWKRI